MLCSSQHMSLKHFLSDLFLGISILLCYYELYFVFYFVFAKIHKYNCFQYIDVFCNLDELVCQFQSLFYRLSFFFFFKFACWFWLEPPMLNRSGEDRKACLGPDLRKKVFSLPSLSGYRFVCLFFVGVLYHGKNAPFFSWFADRLYQG